jgi:hypothetical protein
MYFFDHKKKAVDQLTHGLSALPSWKSSFLNMRIAAGFELRLYSAGLVERCYTMKVPNVPTGFMRSTLIVVV